MLYLDTSVRNVAAFDSFTPAQLTFQASRLISGVPLGACVKRRALAAASAPTTNETRFAEDSGRYNNSAIWTAFNAAPLSSWSPDTQNDSPFSNAQSRRTRPT